MEKKKIALLPGDPAGIGPALAARLLSSAREEFSPLIVGCERIYTAALSRLAPDLIDLFPVYDVPAGFLVRGERSPEGGRMQLEALGKAAHLLLEGRAEAILILGFDPGSVSLFDPGLPDDLAYIRRGFPGRDVKREFILAGSPMTLYRGLPGPAVIAAADARFGEEKTRPEEEKAARDALSFLLSYREELFKRA